jgi:hypothetical protein
MLNSVLAAVLFGTLCARFRDMPQIVANIVQVAFFITPIFWQRRQILAHNDYVVVFNPFAAFGRYFLADTQPDADSWRLSDVSSVDAGLGCGRDPLLCAIPGADCLLGLGWIVARGLVYLTRLHQYIQVKSICVSSH